MIQLVLVRVTIVAKHHDQKQDEEELGWHILNQSPLREAEARNQTRLEPGGRDGQSGGVILTGLLSMAHLAGFCIAHRITSLGMVKAILCWALQNLSLIKKMSCDLAYSPILLKHFLN